jgi:magnesium-transporting ATPase (P-type)
MVACFALKDPLRDDIKESIQKLSEAKIEVRMICGDHLATAKSIASDAGIIEENYAENSGVCMTGEQLINYIGYPEKIIVNG